MNRYFLLIFGLVCFIHLALSYSSVKPVWLTSSFMRAGNEDVIKVLTGQAVDPIYTFTFSSALPGIPNLAYGIKRYRGNDFIGVEQFQIRRLDLTTSTFTVQVDIIGTTNLWVLNVPYIAVDPTFPHHLNSFDNVPINYGTTLVNLTAMSTTPLSYENTINYSVQTAGRKYTKFGIPLQGNKMLLYICALQIWATFRTATQMFPVDLAVQYSIESETTYKLFASLKTNVMIDKLHFSQIVFNSDDVSSSKKYVIVYQIWKTTNLGGFFTLPQQFVDNFIMGVTDFSTIDGKCGFQYQWVFATQDGQFGVQILQSIQLSGACGFSKMTNTIFYMKTWQCDSKNPYFNLTTNQCQDQCGYYYFGNTVVYQCQSCEFGCSKCLNATACLQCDAVADHRRLVTIKGKKVCSCMPGYYQNPANLKSTVCLSCISNCLTCTNSNSCLACNQPNGYILTESKVCKFCGFGCDACVNSNSGCTKCKTGFLYDEANKQCLCPNGTYTLKDPVSCLKCNQKCLTCTGSTEYQCKTCPLDQNRISLKQSNGFLKCVCNPFNYVQPEDGSPVCVKKSVKACDYGYIYIQQQKKCIQICGDGITFGAYKCDDGNQIDGDGCSKTCQVQQGFDCTVSKQTSTCTYVGIINIISARAFKNPFGNMLQIQCQLDPIKSFFYTLNWKEGLVLVGPKMQVIDAWMEGTWLNINVTYFEDLSGKTLTIKYSSTLAKTKKALVNKRNLFDSVFDFDITLRDYVLPIQPVNNLKPTYLSQSTYESVKTYQKSSFIIAICVIVIIILSAMIKSAFPLWHLIFCLQTIFLSIGSIKSMNPLLSGLTQFSLMKGVRSTKIYFQNLVSRNQVLDYNAQVLGYVTSFFGNMNIMAFIQVAVILATGALYLMSKKDLTMQFPFQFAKRQLMLLILFSAMNLAFSICIMSFSSIFEIVIAAIFTIILIYQIYHFLSNMKSYYHMDKIFDLQNSKLKYLIGFLLIGKVIQAAAISIFRKDTLLSTCVILTVEILLTISFIIFRPYRSPIFNVTTIIAQLSVSGFLVINLLLNMQMVNDQELQNRVSFIQIILNYIVALLMVISFGYAVFSDYFSKKVAVLKISLNDTSQFDFKRNKSNFKNSSFAELKVQDDFKIYQIDDQPTMGTSHPSVFLPKRQGKNSRRKKNYQ